MGSYSKEFRSMKNRSNCIFKSFLIVLFIISIVHMSESNVDDVTEATDLLETDKLQSGEEKTEEPLMNQIVYFQGTEQSAIQQNDDIVPASLSQLNSNSLLSFIPDMSAAGDDDDNEQNDAQDSFLIAETGIKGNTKLINGDNPMIRLLRGNRMLVKQQLISNGRKMLLDDDKDNLVNGPSKSRKLYQTEMERIKEYLPSLMKLKRLVKKCQCSYRDEDQISSIKDAIFPNRVDHRINLDYLDNDEENDEDDKDEDDDSQPSDILRQRNYNNFNKYKRFDMNPSFRDDDEMDADDSDDFEKSNKFGEIKNEEDRRVDDLDSFEDILSDESISSSEESIDEEYEETETEILKDEQQDQSNNNNSLNNQENDVENSKLLSPFMTNMSPTSSSDIIFNELTMQANQLDESANQNDENEIQLAKLKRIISDGLLNANNNNDSIKLPQEVDVPDDEDVDSTDEITNPLLDTLVPIPTQYSTLSMSNNRGGGSRVGGNRGGGRNNKRNLLDHLILTRKRRQTIKSLKSQLQGMNKKGNSKSGRN